MVTAEAAKAQVRRFVRHPNFPGSDTPEDKQLRAEMVRAFRDCSSGEHAIAVGDALIRQQDFSPLPSVIYAMADGTAAAFVEGKPSCGACVSGWIITPRGAVRCGCVPKEPQDEPRFDPRKSQPERVDAKQLAAGRDQ